ncbi:MAG: hypothetical protein U1F37_01385 [Alphaproteobacteria bacterium]
MGYDEDNAPNDIAQTGAALATLGHLDALGAFQSGRFDDGLDDSIRTYQAGSGLEPDGVLLPDGPTQRSINDALNRHRPGLSLLPAGSAESEDRDQLDRADLQPSTFRGSGYNFSGNKPPASTAPSHLFGRDSKSGGLEISEEAARNLAAAQRFSEIAHNSLADPLVEPPRGEAGDDDLEQVMKARGYRYVPDPIGRINKGDWIDDHGNRLGADEAWTMLVAPYSPLWRKNAPRDAAAGSNDQHGVRTVPARPFAPARRIATNFGNLAYDLDTATNYVKRGEGDVRLAIPLASTATTTSDVAAHAAQINVSLREAMVANALMRRATPPDELASVIKGAAEKSGVGPQDGRSRIKDMLIEAATNASNPDARLHAKGLLAVYEAEERQAEAAGADDPRADADAALAAFGAAMHGDVSWSVYDPSSGDEDEVQPAGDAPDPSQKPRGMHNPKVRDSVIEGQRRDAEIKDRVRAKGGNWKANPHFKNKFTGTFIRPDIWIKEWDYLIEIKPNTITGRIAGALQCAIYTAVTGFKCRVVYYEPSWKAPTPPNTTEPGRGAPRTGTGGRTGAPMLGNPTGMGSNPGMNPKLRSPLRLIN